MLLADNLDLFRSAAPKDTNNEGQPARRAVTGLAP
jgi:hypothetical protein